MKVYLSHRDYIRNFESFLKAFDTNNPETLAITANENWVNVHPVVLTIIAALAKTINPSQISIDNITAKSGHYLHRMGLFDFIQKKSPFKIELHESAGRFIPITQIRTPEEQTKFITEMIPLLHLSPEHADPIKYTIGELVRNVLEHANTKNGAFVAAQYYPNGNTVRIGICDTGIGILKTIRESWSAPTDLDAIKLALTPGITGTTKREGGNEVNAGAGLFFIKSMAMVSRDYFIIYSGSGLYKLTKRDKRTTSPRLKINPEDDKHSETNAAPHFPGTVVAIDISLDETKEFTELLSTIREAYVKAVKERRKEKFRSPKFI